MIVAPLMFWYTLPASAPVAIFTVWLSATDEVLPVLVVVYVPVTAVSVP